MEATEAERAAMGVLRAKMAKYEEASAGLPAMAAAFGGAEPCMLRFLRARKLDPDRAFDAYCKTMRFRQQHQLGTWDAVSELREGVADCWCAAYAGTAPNGAVVTYWRLQYLHVRQLRNQFDEQQLFRFYTAWMERGLQLQQQASPTCPGGLDIYDLGE